MEGDIVSGVHITLYCVTFKAAPGKHDYSLVEMSTSEALTCTIQQGRVFSIAA